MRFYYDESGDLAVSSDQEVIQRNNVQTMLTASRYRLVPDAAPGLSDFLGPAPSRDDVSDSKDQIRRALNAIGMPNTSVDAVLEIVDEEFHLKAGIGKQSEVRDQS